MCRVCGSAKKKRKEGFTMRKFSLILALLLMTATAWARVDIICSQVGDTNEITVSYVVVGEDPNIRAFALDIYLSNDVNIIGIGTYKTGESVVGDKGYGIFPSSFAQNIDPEDPDWDDENYSPLANEADYPDDTLGGLDTNGITVELGSLYVGDTNKPASSGNLLTFYIESENCGITIEENQIRGGVVMVDPNDDIDVNSPGCEATFGCLVVGQYVGGVMITQAMVDLWDSVGRPDCWCYDCHWRADTDGDCDVDYPDVLNVIAGWNDWNANQCGDTDNDGDVDYPDVLQCIAGWNNGCTDASHPGYPTAGTCAPIP
jgi:hypothetical protein